MRKVGCYAAYTSLANNEDSEKIIDGVIRLCRDWLQEKGSNAVLSDSGQFGTGGSYEFKTNRADGCRLDEINLHEQNAHGGSYVTKIILGTMKGDDNTTVDIYVEMRAGGKPMLMMPLKVDARCPMVLREVFKKRRWIAGNGIIKWQAIPMKGETAANVLIELLNAPDRNLPVVVVSTSAGGQAFADNIQNLIAYDLVGLATVVEIDPTASWEITRKLGREWSCFDKAVRLYWPFNDDQDNKPYIHPYWKKDELLGAQVGHTRAGDRLRRTLRNILMTISTHAMPEPKGLLNIRDMLTKQRLAELKRRGEEAGHWESYAEELASEIEKLKNRLLDVEDENDSLRHKVSSYEANLKNLWVYEPQEEDIRPTIQPSFDCLAAAVDEARSSFKDLLLFGDDVSRGIRELDDNAGPPTKIFEYLKTLSEMVDCRRKGTLGKDMIVWLSDRGATASNESKTVENNRMEKGKRTWGWIPGTNTKRYFSCHLKPNEATGRRRCVRIYFDYCEEYRQAVIGWIGPHP